MKQLYIAILSLFIIACGAEKKVETLKEDTNPADSVATEASIINEGETHFASLKQLTDGGDNAEAYWSFDDSKLVFQVSNPEWELECDQVFVFDWQNDNLMKKIPQMVSTGLGRTTCSYFLPGDTTIVYASTHLADSDCPPTPERTNGRYVWPIYESFDIFTADLEGNIIKQITFDLGYDGGAFFSPDGTKLIFRSSRPKTVEEVKKYKDLLAEGLVEPTNMELYICNADGSELRQLTDLGKANWCPFFHPSGEKVIFASNHHTERGFPFNLYMINIDGTGLEQVTNEGTFDAFPVFSNDGKHLVFSSNRNNGGTRETNLFVAEWQD